MKLLITTFFSLFITSVLSQNITVDETRTAQDLVQNVLFNNSGCATISNVSVSGGNFGTGEKSYAYFDGNNSVFPFEEGIVLSTGTANHCIGPNTNLSSDEGINWGTDVDLAAIFTNTLNATVLEFDFVPVSDYISFDYIFASEEYQEGNNNTCQYSDVFAFLIKATSDINYTNIAVVPNTNIPVQVTTVHPEVSSSCQAENEAYFGSWNDATAPINFNGQTAVLKAESNVVAGQTYHIKLVIADHTNYQYDSAVFLKAGSFNVGTNLGLDLLRTTGNALCGTETTTIDSGVVGATSYTWSRDDFPYDDVFVPLIGGNNQTYTATTEGKYKVIVDLGGGCLSEGNIRIEYGTIPMVSDTELIRCDDLSNQFSIFNLTNSNENTTNGDLNLIVENYYHSYNDALNENNEISNFANYPNTMQNELIYARIKGIDGCINIARIRLRVFKNPELKDDESLLYCLNTYPDTITLEGGILNDDPNNYQYQWFFDNKIDPVIDLNINTATIQVNEIGDYNVEIISNDGCVVHRTITVNASNIATITNILVSDIDYSNKVSLIVEVVGEGDYEYALDDYNFQDSNIFDNVSYGYHIITVRDKNGCLPNTQKEITILEYEKFLTPNNDGNYDTWNIVNPASLIHYNTISEVTIFDRFGKIMAVIDSNGLGWDGNYQNAPAPPADYWFRVTLKDYKGKITNKDGHFSLIR